MIFLSKGVEQKVNKTFFDVAVQSLSDIADAVWWYVSQELKRDLLRPEGQKPIISISNITACVLQEALGYLQWHQADCALTMLSFPN